MSTIDQIKADFASKILTMQSVAYPQVLLLGRSMASDIEESKLGQTLQVAGRIRSMRGHGKLFFVDLQDVSGNLQVLFKSDLMGENFALVARLDVGDIVCIEGKLDRSNTGVLTLFASKFDLLTKIIHPLPEKWHGLTDSEERYRSRYLDMIMNETVRKNLQVRTRFVKGLREFLDNNDFLEIETPILQPLYGGASAKPFTTFYEAMDSQFYLRISDELYLKRLLVGGFERVYEIGKDFRNEGLSRAHNPEFTMLEFYFAYRDHEFLMDFTQDLLRFAIDRAIGTLEIDYEGQKLDFGTNFPRKEFAQLFVEYLQFNINRSEAEVLNEFKSLGLLTGDMQGYGYRDAVDNVYKKHIRPKLIEPIFITNYPSAMLPLAKPLSKNNQFAGSFQLVVAGMEVIKAYDELNDPFVLRRLWEEEAKLAHEGAQDAQPIDEDFLRALEVGMPPTAGWGMGIDRMCALLTNSHSIKELIAFPTLKKTQ